MEYFEIDEDNSKEKIKKIKRYKCNHNNTICFISSFTFICFLLLLFSNDIIPKELQSADENNNNNHNKINENISIFSFEINPHLHTEFILNLLTNYLFFY